MLNPQKHDNMPTGFNVCKILAISAFILYILIMYHIYQSSVCTSPVNKKLKQATSSPPPPPSPPTDIRQLVFTIAGSVKTWRSRGSYFREWWRPNVTRGYIYFDKEPTAEFLPWPYDNFPPYRVSENTTKLVVYSRHAKPDVIRIVRTILESFREGDKDVRWYVMGDDDTIFFLDNLVQLLGRYDHTKYVYIGGVSECVKSNLDISFEMAYGGGGFALSYPLVEALVANLDRCIETYPFYLNSDQIISACITDLGVPFTSEKGFHQIDLVHNISGFLSAHPHAPLISLHHLDIVSPIFPTMDRHKSLRHLMTSAKVDQSRLLQQTVCYHKQKNWAFSIAWGYSACIYEQLIPRSILRRPLETFTPWSLNQTPPYNYMFNSRLLTTNSCETPHNFYFHSISNLNNDNNYYDSNSNITTYEVMTTYVRYKPRELPPCSPHHSADYITKIRVYSPATKLNFVGNRGECCDVLNVDGNNNTAEVRIRACKKTEIII
ncbi:hypothetical protein HanXRQr2_Chr02g0076511 [Helianthus annuus]|nr:uncharacterized protein LOC110918083 [Helianthus annuus]KAF5819339.1 hypothetical protein HanXRQr2_Chr02g0076511 [Helianthus annuus]KAJ0605497.1 hypothetical protein HanHA300_Chr02g0063701 [Helianthus annuus]KAJ0616323.1 hypothetical protein HanIR_Chr02g0089341 [Helianthus annuus]KAJ0777973.1 hypothetical protein HanLR1_Chr02g0066601 [Helianthus annuus]KAJ0786983.1 hypothetical protein HanOQP8_Chr02g0077431 [Helianthus annuus]